MQVDPKHLVQLNVIVECGSFALAADQLALTQPALTRNIRLLEDRVGARLLDRGRLGARPTELGRMLSAKGKALREILEAANTTASQIRTGELGVLRVGTSFGVATDLWAAPLSTFFARSPLTTVKATTGPMPALLEALSRGELDVVIGGVQLMEPNAGIVFETLADNRLLVLARREHPLAAGTSVLDLEQLRRSRWIVRPTSDPLRAEISSALTALGVDDQAIALETANTPLALRLLEQTDLLMLEPVVTAQDRLQEALLVELPLPQPLIIRPLGMAYHDDRLPGPTTRLFIQILRAWAAGRFGGEAAS